MARDRVALVAQVETSVGNDSRIANWGNSLAVRIPLAIAKQASLTEGDPVKLALDGEEAIVMRPVPRKYELSDSSPR